MKFTAQALELNWATKTETVKFTISDKLGKSVVIFFGSQTAVKAISCVSVVSKLV